MTVNIKLHSETNSVHLSRKNVERYVDYKIKKIYSKSFVNNDNVTISIDQREKGDSTVKLITNYLGKNIVIIEKGENPYQLIKYALEKLERKLRKIKDSKKSLSSYHKKGSAKEKMHEEQFKEYDVVEKQEELVTELNFETDEGYSDLSPDIIEKFFDNDEMNGENEEEYFQKIINEY